METATQREIEKRRGSWTYHRMNRSSLVRLERPGFYIGNQTIVSIIALAIDEISGHTLAQLQLHLLELLVGSSILV
jgi:hypothetical protein